MDPFKKYLLITLALALLNAVLILAFFFPRYDHTDTPQYISAIENIAGDKTAEIAPYRMLKPLPILIGAFLTNFTSAENTLIVQNVFFYFLLVVLVYLFVYKLYHSGKQALYGTILVMTAFPMLAYGLASLTDLSGWFFFFLSAFLSLSFLKNPSLKTAVLPGLVAGLGMLFKESVAAAPIFFVSLIFIAGRFPLKDKIKYILIFGLAFLVFPTINVIAIYNLFSYHYLDTFQEIGAGGKVVESFYMYTWPRIIIEIGRVFLVGWIFVLIGLWKEIVLKHKERGKILLSFLLPSLSAFLWIAPHNRILFIAFPYLALLGGFGLLKNFKNPRNNLLAELGLLILYVAMNYAVLNFLLDYGIYFWKFGDFSY
ncbi:MAG: glycosyltransferase family 39 protein [bacterium]|nr:glycosyltransferase family 39 protein [bacterium]